MSEIRQLVLRESPYCGACPINLECHEGRTDLGCSPDFVAPDPSSSSVLHPTSSDFVARIAEVNGVCLDIAARFQHIPALPPYIPRIRPGSRIADFRGIATVALPLKHVRQLAAAAERRGCTAKQVLGLAEHQQLLVTGFEKDQFLERWWPLPRRFRLLRAISTIQPDAATAWGYSVWHRDAAGRRFPRPEHLYNQKRSLVIFRQLQNFGVPAIPHVYWGVREDLRRWADWLARNPCVSTIAIDLQTTDTTSYWNQAINDIAYFASIVPDNITCLFSGVCKITRIKSIRDARAKSVLCNYGPFYELMLSNDCVHFRDEVLRYTELMEGAA